MWKGGEMEALDRLKKHLDRKVHSHVCLFVRMHYGYTPEIIYLP